jgi:EpsD family peptidyl-prolyl cis-trans isomerase
MKFLSTTLVLSSALMLTACNSASEPTGQVVATVNGKEITSTQLDAEMGPLRAGSTEEQQQMRRAALQQIINRYLLADAAEKQDLANTPAGAIAKQKAEQIAYVTLLQQSLGRNVPTISADEVQQFILDNPDLFGARKIFLVEQIAIASPSASLIKELEPLTTIDQVRAVLAKYSLPTHTSMGVIDALAMEPGAVRQIAALKQNEIFLLPKDGDFTVNLIRETRVEPVVGEAATKIAGDLLQNARTNQQVYTRLSEILRDGMKTVRYNKALDLAPRKGEAQKSLGPAPRPGGK